MKKGRFSNFGNVFCFTFVQGAKSASFKVLTFLIPAILLVVFSLISIIPAAIEKSSLSDAAAITKVYLVDETGSQMFASAFEQLYDRDTYKNLRYQSVNGKSAAAVCKEIPEDETGSFVISLTTDEDTDGTVYFKVTAIIPDFSGLSEDDIGDLLDTAVSAAESVKVYTADVDYDSLVYLSSYIYTDVVKAMDTPDDMAVYVIKMIMPMIVILVIYMMVILYGQSIGKCVAAEKNSRLIEMLLTSVAPESLILGKVAAQTCTAIVQFMLCVAGAVAGCFLGDFAADLINPGTQNVILEAIKLIMAEGGSAFSAPAVILAFLAAAMGFAFYCALSGLVACFVGKTEELSQTMGIYNMIVLLGFFGAYYPEIMENEMLKTITYFIPFTSAFNLASDICVGNTDLLTGAAALIVLAAGTVAVVLISARIYKARIFYAGTGLKKHPQ